MSGLASVRSVVVLGADGIAEALAGELRARGIASQAQKTLQLSDGPLGVIYLGGLRDDDAGAIQREAFALARAFATHATDNGGLFVTVQDTGGDFGLSGSDRAWLGGLAGLAKTADLEWPKTSVRAIDLERAGRDDAAIARAIAQEVIAGGDGIEVGLSAEGDRVVLESVRTAAVPVRPSPLGPDSVLVCSGGARGVTASTLIALAKQHLSAIALLGRTPITDEPAACVGADTDAALKRALLAAAQQAGLKVKPAELGSQVRRILAVREIRATVAAIEAAGGRARYFSVDVTDTDSVSSALAEVRGTWGPITGIVHGAGVVADKLIADKTDEQFARVFDTKVLGLRALLDATQGDPLDTLIVFSSVAGRSGNTGQCDYAMANEVLNKVAAAERRRRPGLVVKSLGWGPWEGGMVTPSLKAYFESHGVPLISLEAGATMLLDELRADPDAVEVVLGAPPQRAAIAGSEPNEVCFDVLFHHDLQPYLRDHAVQGTPVLPMTMALDLCAKTAAAILPGRVVTACRDLKMYRGVVLDRFDGGHWLTVRSRPNDDRTLAITICDAERPELPHYAVTIELADTALAAPPFEAPDLELAALGVPVYETLFHGPAFQIIEAVEGVGDNGIVAHLCDAERSWGLTLDAGLQLALLWTQHRLGGKALPTGLGANTRYTSDPPSGPLKCTLVGRSHDAHSTVSDITFVDAHGRVVSRLTGVETHQRP